MRRLIPATAITVDTAAYAAGDLVGAKLSFENAARRNGSGGEIRSIRLVDQANQKKALTLFLFDSNPTGTTFTDNGALDIADADMTKLIGHIVIAAADYKTVTDNAIVTLKNIGLGYTLNAITTMYAAIMADEAVTYTAATDLLLILSVNPD